MTGRGRFAWVVSWAAGALLVVAVGVGAFALLFTLDSPTPSEKLAARVIGRLDSMREARTSLTLARFRAVRTTCLIDHLHDEIQIGPRLRLRIGRARVRRLSGPRQDPPVLAALAALSACPRFLANGLSARLYSDRETLVSTTRFHRLRVDVFDVSNYAHWPVVQLLVTRRKLVPVAIRFRSHRLNGEGTILQMSRNRHPLAPRTVISSIS